MLDIGWSEMLLIAVVAIIVVGPKDLPAMLRTIGSYVAKMRQMAGEFQQHFNDAVKEADLDDIKQDIDSMRNMNPINHIKDELNPLKEAVDEVKETVEKPISFAGPKSPPVEEPKEKEPVVSDAKPVKSKPRPAKAKNTPKNNTSKSKPKTVSKKTISPKPESSTA